jgi:hypothetical protein
MKHHLVRLDRIAGELNGWLLAIAIGLGMLDLTVLIAKSLPPLPRTPTATSADAPSQMIVRSTPSQTPASGS